MSLWTPDGEHDVDQDVDRDVESQLRDEMEQVRRELASVPASVVVANHAMGLYELAAIHLSNDPPNFAEAQVAIDALGAIVEQLHDRLGDAEPTLIDALNQMRMAYVQLHAAQELPDE